MTVANDQMVKDHYKKEAEIHGESSYCTMDDEIIRNREIDIISRFIKVVTEQERVPLKVLDLGCGNGYTLSCIIKSIPLNNYFGLDFSGDQLSIAKNRNLESCSFAEGDARNLPYENDFFDVIYTERCLINILDWEEQQAALREIHRVLKPNGYYLMIECFTDGLINNNKARQECGLEPLAVRYHNKYFDKEKFMPVARALFSLMNLEDFTPQCGGSFLSNFLSSHYFVARVLHPLISKGPAVKNTEFVKFFSYLPPVGNYSPIQSYILKK